MKKKSMFSDFVAVRGFERGGEVGFHADRAHFGTASPDLNGDGARDLGYDRNGSQSGNYNGTKPDVGGRETGTPACPQ